MTYSVRRDIKRIEGYIKTVREYHRFRAIIDRKLRGTPYHEPVMETFDDVYERLATPIIEYLQAEKHATRKSRRKPERRERKAPSKVHSGSEIETARPAPCAKPPANPEDIQMDLRAYGIGLTVEDIATARNTSAFKARGRLASAGAKFRSGGEGRHANRRLATQIMLLKARGMNVNQITVQHFGLDGDIYGPVIRNYLEFSAPNGTREPEEAAEDI